MNNTVLGPLSPESRCLEELSDNELLQEVSRRAAHERHATVDVIRGLIELDRRQLYLAAGYPSLFSYCTGSLHYSEHAAFNRIEVARAAAQWPQLLASLEDGSLHLAGARILAPHLTADNIAAVLECARHRSKRDIEEIAARIAQRSMLIAVDAEEYRLFITISRATRDALRQVQALMGEDKNARKESVIFAQAITLLLERLQRQRYAASDRPRTSVPEGSGGDDGPSSAATDGDPSSSDKRSDSRHIPNAVQRAVWKRDDGRCAFVGTEGRCPEKERLEFHHLVPFAAGGRTTTSNIELRCRSHNVYEAEVYFGREVVTAARQRRQSRASQKAGTEKTPPSQPEGASGEEFGGTRPGASSPSGSSAEPAVAVSVPVPDLPDGENGKPDLPSAFPNRGMAWIRRLASPLKRPQSA